MRMDMSSELFTGLNAPFGARCFLTGRLQVRWHRAQGLNAPFGARCFLTRGLAFIYRENNLLCLNAPFGARCFLTSYPPLRGLRDTVLMHRLALVAF